MLKKCFKAYAVVSLVLALSIPVLANKSSVTIDAPDSAREGEIISIRIKVTHKGNNFFHYTNWVYIKINDKEIARWGFTGSKRPEDETFTREVKYKVESTMTIVAEANCNIHGSAGKAIKTIQVK
jgi:desulfoferrodoxin (superoxide reductase-like protein)